MERNVRKLVARTKKGKLVAFIDHDFLEIKLHYKPEDKINFYTVNVSLETLLDYIHFINKLKVYRLSVVK